MPSSDATLSNLTSSTGTLTPNFAPATTGYTLAVGHSVTTLTLTPTVNEPNATAVVNNGNPITLAVGVNLVPVTVTAQDTTTTQTYFVTINRAASSDATLSSLGLINAPISPNFSPAVTSYTATVHNLVTTETVIAAPNHSGATVVTNNGNPITLVVGTNTIPVEVTAADGTTKITYTVTITRSPSSDATLSNLISSIGTLTPGFAPATTAYTLAVGHSVTTLTLTPTVNEPNARAVINGGLPIGLVVGANPITVTVTAQDGTTTRQYTVTVTRAPSSDATLSNLTSSTGTLTPNFAPATTAYTLAVNHSVTTLTLTPTVNEPNATAVVNNGNPITLAVGVNLVPVTVTAQDTTTTQTYFVTINRAASSDATLSSLGLINAPISPNFSPAVTSYTATVHNLVTTETVIAAPNHSGATVVTNNGNPITLVVGTNTIPVEVTAADGTTKITYTVTITRSPSSDATLSNLISSIGTLTPGFAPATTAYTLAVNHSVTTLTLTPTVNEPNATAVINGGLPIGLVVGANPITVTVTAQDGTTTRQYTVTVTRAPSSDATLSNLISSTGTLTPGFAPATTAYSFTVANAVTTLTLTPTVNDPNATAVVNNGNPITLAVGVNLVPVTVTAQDTTTTQTYFVTINRAASSDATLSSLGLINAPISPNFSPAVTSYTATVHNLVTTETVIAAPNHSGATVVTNNGNPITLVVGTNTIPVEVTAADGTTKITYTVTITRSPSSDATLSNLISSIGTLTPGFAPATTAYTLAVNHSVTTLTLTPTVNEPNATAVINGGLPIGLVVGANPITVTVTAQDGTTTRQYTVTVTRAPSSDATLSNLISSTGTLTPRLCAGHDRL